MSPRERIASTRLYLVCDARPRRFLDAALRGGVDVLQLRDKTLTDEALVAAARPFRAAADAHGALFVLNDRPERLPSEALREPAIGLRGRRRGADRRT